MMVSEKPAPAHTIEYQLMSIDCHISGRDAKISLEPPVQFLANDPASTGLSGQFADRHVSIFMDKVMFIKMVQQFEPFWEWDDLTPDKRAAMMRWFLHDVLEKLNVPTIFLWSALNESVNHNPSEGHHVHARIECGEQTLQLQMICDEKTYGSVLEKVNSLNAIQNPPEKRLNVDLGICIDVINLPKPALKKLIVGDAIMLSAENAYRSEDRIACRVIYDGQTVQYGDLAARSLTLNGKILLDSVTEKNVRVGHGVMASQSSDDQGDVKVMFELAHLTVSLEQLAAFGSGDVLDIGRTPTGLVGIIADAQYIGAGKIIDLDGLAAVVVTELQS